MSSKRVGLSYDPLVLLHQTPEGHPERSARISETFALLERTGTLERLTRLSVIPATRMQLARVHTPTYLDTVERIAAAGGGYLDSGDTFASPYSWAAATTAAGASIGAV